MKPSAIAKAVEDVLVAANATSGHARVVPVGKMRSRVMRSVRRRQIGEANGDA